MKKSILLTILSLLITGVSFVTTPLPVFAATCSKVITDPTCECAAPRQRIPTAGGEVCVSACRHLQSTLDASGQIQCACPAVLVNANGQCLLVPAAPAGGGGTGVDKFGADDAAAGPGITNPVTGNLGNNPVEARQGTTFTNFLITLWRAIISVGGLMVLIYFLWGGIEWITAGGDTAKVQKARDRITQSIIGLVILVASFVIIGFISELFFGPDFNLLEITIPTPI